MGQFKRARLGGSEELFRPTRPAPPKGKEAPEDSADGPQAVAEGPAEPSTGKLRVELSGAEVKAIVDALQLARFPERQRTRPTMVEFERLGELQERLRRLVAE